jgi:hypothetical protein
VSRSTVECYSGHTYAQEPRALVWEGQRYIVVQVEARWRTPEGPAFRVRTEAGERFDLHHHELEDRWAIADLPRYQSTNHNGGQGGPERT